MSYKTYEVRVYDNGTQEWHQNGERHRDDGPAIIWENGGQAWFQNGKLHREDGPAYIGADCIFEWYLKGIMLTESEFLEKTQGKQLTVEEIEKCLGYKVKIISG